MSFLNIVLVQFKCFVVTMSYGIMILDVLIKYGM